MEACDRDFLSRKLLERYGDVSAIALYGSRAAGYARKESDYDILVVMVSHSPRITYDYYKSSSDDMSALVVDRKAFEDDAESGAMGEFVVGRLINPYEPLHGEDILKSAERIYKKRIVRECITGMLSEFKGLAYELSMPPEYFLFEKQRQRAAVWPALKYSVGRAYTGEIRRGNLDRSMKAFNDALDELQEEGFVSLDDGRVMIDRSQKAGRLDGLAGASKFVSRGAMLYAHFLWSGRNVVHKLPGEVLSKISRKKSNKSVSEDLKHPKSLLDIGEGRLITKYDWLSELAGDFGYDDFSYDSKCLGDVTSTVFKYRLTDNENETDLVVKKYQDLRSLKWSGVNILCAFTKKFETHPLSRLAREYSALKDLKKAGIRTPKVYGVVPGERILAIEFVEHDTSTWEVSLKALGGDEESLAHIREYGRAVGRVHETGYAIGDTKPGNALFTNGEPCIIDLEQAEMGGDQSWDVINYLYCTAVASLSRERMRRITGEFVEGYLERGSRDTLEKALDLKYQIPFVPLTLSPMPVVIRDEIRSRLE